MKGKVLFVAASSASQGLTSSMVEGNQISPDIYLSFAVFLQRQIFSGSSLKILTLNLCSSVDISTTQGLIASFYRCSLQLMVYHLQEYRFIMVGEVFDVPR